MSALSDYLASIGLPDVSTNTGPSTAASDLTKLYQSALGRAPDEAGYNWWLSQIGDTLDPNEITWFTSGAQSEIDQYKARLAEQAAQAAQAAQPVVPAQTATEIQSLAPAPVTTQPTGALSSVTETPVTTVPTQTAASALTQLYQDVLGRDPDQAGFDWWLSQIGDTLDPAEVQQFIAGSKAEIDQNAATAAEEAALQQGALQTVAPKSQAEKDLTDLYQTYLGRNPDAPGLQWWLSQVGDTLDPNEVAAFKAASRPEFDQRNNEIFAGLGFQGALKNLSGREAVNQRDVDSFLSLYDTPENRATYGDSIFDELKNTSKKLGIQQGFSNLTSNAYASQDDINSLLSKNSAEDIIATYGQDTYDALKKAAGEQYSGAYGGKNFTTLNPLAVDSVFNQLKAQQNAGTAQYYSGGALGTGRDKGSAAGFGSIDALTYDMAKNLVASGVTDINQIKQAPARTYVDGDPKNGFSVQSWEDVYTTGDGEAGPGYSRQMVTKSIPASSVKQDGAGNYYVEDPSKKMIINGAKDTPLLSNYAERTGGNSWSGTYAGKGNTAYNVQFDAQGRPVFYTTGASSSDAADWMPIVALAANIFLPGVGSSLSAGLASIGGSALAAGSVLNAALTQGIISGVTSAAMGGQFADGFKAGAITGGAASGLNAIVPSDVAAANPQLTKALTSAGAAGISAAVNGGDIEQALTNSLVNSAVKVGTVGALSDSGLTQSEANAIAKVVTPIVSSLVQNGNVSDQTITNALISAAGTAISSGILSDSGLTPDKVPVVDKSIAGTLEGQQSTDTGALAAQPPGDSELPYGDSQLAQQTSPLSTVATTETAPTDQADTLTTTDASDAAQTAFNQVINAGGSTEDAKAVADLVSGQMADAGGVPDTQTVGGGADTVQVGNQPDEWGNLQGAIDQNAMDDAIRENKLSAISEMPKFNDAFAAARDLLGAGQTFTWNGKEYSTSTAEERPDLAVKPATEAGAGRGSYEGYSAAADAYNKGELAVAQNLANLAAMPTSDTAGAGRGFVYFSQPQSNLTDPKAWSDILQYIPTSSDEFKTDAMGNIVVGNIGTLDPNSELGKTVLSFNNAVGKAVQTGISNLAMAGGDQLQSYGGALAALHITDPGNFLTQAGNLASDFGKSIETKSSVESAKNFYNDVKNAEGIGGKMVAAVVSAFKNPEGVTNWIAREGLQEILPIGAGKAVTKFIGLAAGIGVDQGLNAVESMGSSYEDTYNKSLKAGMSKEDADALATKVGFTAAAITLATMGVADAAVIKALTREATGSAGAQLAKASTKEGFSENIEETATALATQYLTGGNIDLNSAMTQGAIGQLVGHGTAGSVGAVEINTHTDTTTQNITADLNSGVADLSGTLTGSVTSGVDNGLTAAQSAGSVTTALINSGADVAQNIGSVVSSSIEASSADQAPEIAGSIVSTVAANNGDLGSVINTVISTSADNDANVADVASNVVSSGINSGGDPVTVIDNAVTSSLGTGASTSDVVGSVVGAGISSGADVSDVISAAISSSVQASADSNASISESIADSITAAVDAASNNGMPESAVISSSVTSAVDTATQNGSSFTEASNTAVTTAMDAATKNEMDTVGAIENSVSSAVTATSGSEQSVQDGISGAVSAVIDSTVQNNGDISEAVQTSSTAAVNAAIQSGADATVAIDGTVTQTITSAAENKVDVGSVIESTVGSSVQAAMDNGTTADVAIDTAVGSAVAAATQNDVSLSDAVSNSVSSAVDAAMSNGTTAEEAIGPAVSSAVTAAVENKADVTESIESSIGAAIEAATNNNVSVEESVAPAVSAAVDSAISSGSDVSETVSTAINAAVESATSNSLDVVAATDSAVQSATGSVISSMTENGATTDLAIDTAISTVVETAANNDQVPTEAAVESAVSSSVSTAIENGSTTEEAVYNSTQSGISSAIDNGVAPETAIDLSVSSAVESAIKSDASPDEAITSAVTSAVESASQNNVDTTQAVEQSVQSAIESATSNDVSVTQAVDSAVSAAVSSSTESLGTSGAIESAINTAVETASNNNLDVEAASETAVSSAVSSSVESQISSGTAPETAIQESVASAIETAASNSSIETEASVSTAVSSAVETAVQNDVAPDVAVSTTVSSAVEAAVSNDVAPETAISNSVAPAVETALDNNVAPDVAVESAVSSAVETAVNNNVDANTAIDSAVSSAVQTAVNNNVEPNTAIDSAVSTAIETAVNNNVETNTAVETAVNSAIETAINNNVDPNTAINTAVGTAVETAVNNNVETNTAVETSVGTAIETAINNNVDANTAIDSAVSSAIDAAANTSADVNTAIDSAVGTAVETAINNNVDVNTAVDTAVGTAVEAAINNNVDTQTAIETAINSAVGATTNTDQDTSAVVETAVNSAVTAAINSNVDPGEAVATAIEVAKDLNVDTPELIDAAVNAAVDASVAQKETQPPEGQAESTADMQVNVTPPEPVVTGGDASTITTATPKTSSGSSPRSSSQPSGGGISLPTSSSQIISGAPHTGVDPTFLQSKVTGGIADPLAKMKAIQQEMEKDQMMQNIDPRLAALLQQQAGQQPQGLGGNAGQLGQNISALGALASLFGGQGAQAAPEAAPAPENAYYSYGTETPIESILGGSQPAYAGGGYVEPLKAAGGSMTLPLLAKKGGALSGREDFKDGKHVAGEGDGQSDDIPAWLADGEFVFPADVVSALGNGSTKAGTDKLYEMMHSIRDRARSKGPKDLPPPALKSPLDYLKSKR